MRATFTEGGDNNDEAIPVIYKNYYPFGWEVPGAEKPEDDFYRFAYQGQFAEKDQETGFTQFEARLFDNRIGRWMCPDPAGQYHSPYLGMGNSPLNSTDPDGEIVITGAVAISAAMAWLIAGGCVITWYAIETKPEISIDSYSWDHPLHGKLECHTGSNPFEGNTLNNSNLNPKGNVGIIATVLITTLQISKAMKDIQKTEITFPKDVQLPTSSFSENILQLSPESQNVITNFLLDNIENISDKAIEGLNNLYEHIESYGEDAKDLTPEQIYGLLHPQQAIDNEVNRMNE